MSTRYSQKHIYALLALMIMILSCSKDEQVTEDVEVNDFVWGAMNAYYRWQGDVEDLSDQRFINRLELNNYLRGFESPEDLFANILHQYGTVDLNSTIVPDYLQLQQQLDGLQLTTGLGVAGANFANGSGEFYVYITNVLPGSSAETNGLTRGMYILEVNGNRLTRNNVDAFFSLETFTITLADYNSGNPISNNTTVTLTSSLVQENPIGPTLITDLGTNKIGYVAYNRFIKDYDGELNNVFADFQAESITDLIIDLRYNDGGDLSSAVHLASMITGQFTGDVFTTQRWNDKVLTNVNPENLETRFTNRIINKNEDGFATIDEAANSLGLSSVHFIVTNRTMGTAEVLITALEPYIDVTLIGTATAGNYSIGTTMFFDADDYTFNGPNFNTSHTWAIIPETFQIENSDSSNEPESFIVDVQIEEDPNNLIPLGDVTEPLLARAIEYITTGAKSLSSSNTSFTRTTSDWNSDHLDILHGKIVMQLK